MKAKSIDQGRTKPRYRMGDDGWVGFECHKYSKPTKSPGSPLLANQSDFFLCLMMCRRNKLSMVMEAAVTKIKLLGSRDGRADGSYEGTLLVMSTV